MLHVLVLLDFIGLFHTQVWGPVKCQALCHVLEKPVLGMASS